MGLTSLAAPPYYAKTVLSTLNVDYRILEERVT